jgi:DNA-binding response OmpR family regulator
MRARVLVVDDDPEVRALVSRRLQRSGYSVEEAADGEEGLAFVRKEVPDLVVTDMAMPRLDGLGLIQALHRIDPELPVIVLTGQGSLDNVIDALRDGALFDYLLKPLADVGLLDVAVKRAEEMRALRARSREADQVAAMRGLAVTACDLILNPLNAITLGLATLTRPESTPEARARAAEIIRRSIDTITMVVRQMRTVVRYTPQEVALGLRGIDLQRAITEPQDPEG